jgi:hypothetical protein
MTQFIVVTADASCLEPPVGMSVLPLEPELLPMLDGVFPGCAGPYAQVVDTKSGAANALLDALHDEPDRGIGAALMTWLEQLDGLGCGIAMWYSNDSAELPRYRRWDEFARAVRREAAAFPPEVYAVNWPMLDESELEVMGWCDVNLLGISWLNDGRDLALHLRFAKGVERHLHCLWAHGVRIDLTTAEDCLGEALTWDTTFERNALGWKVMFDFASTGTIALMCTGLKLLGGEP